MYEQIIPSKTKFVKFVNTTSKTPQKTGFKNLLRAGAFGIMYDIHID